LTPPCYSVKLKSCYLKKKGDEKGFLCKVVGLKYLLLNQLDEKGEEKVKKYLLPILIVFLLFVAYAPASAADLPNPFYMNDPYDWHSIPQTPVTFSGVVLHDMIIYDATSFGLKFAAFYFNRHNEAKIYHNQWSGAIVNVDDTIQLVCVLPYGECWVDSNSVGFTDVWTSTGNPSIQIFFATQPIYNSDDTVYRASDYPQLTVNLSPQAGGTAVSSPTGLACVDSTCQGYFSGDVTLTASAASGWVFDHWEINGQPICSTSTYVVTVNSAQTVTAVFKFNLAFPLQIDCSGVSCTPYTASVSAVFDHSATAGYTSDTDHHVTTFNGEVSDNTLDPYSDSQHGSTTCYPKSDYSAFGSGFNYQGISGAGSYYLCYDGHPGIDYPVGTSSTHVAVYAAADGIAHIPSSFPGVSDAQAYNTMEIDHQNGYKTYYLHLHSQNVTENQQVYKGQTIIGYSGDTGASGAYHLHFEVQKETSNGWVPVDPYGWMGSGTDPYTRATNITLWE